MTKYDVIIIGFGKCGKTIAAECANRGNRVALIEASKMMYGGTCINIGCIPSKKMAHLSSLSPKTDDFQVKRTYFEQSAKEKKVLIAALNKKNYEMLHKNPNITIYDGLASFASAEEVKVQLTEGGEISLTADKIIINTGAQSFIPDIKGVKDNAKVVTSTELLSIEELPQRLTIIGGGYIGLEFASMFANYGSQVTILEGKGDFIPKEDRDIAAAVLERLTSMGINVILNAKIDAVEDTNVRYTDSQTQEQKVEESDLVLLATGRRPRVAALNLNLAGIELTERGAIKVNEFLETSQKNIYAVGDVNGGPQFTYISLDDYRILKDHFWGEGKRSTLDRGPVAYSVFIDPPLSRIGMSEEEAKKSDLNFKVNSLPVNSIPRAKTLGSETGIFKMIVDKDTSMILGCTLYGVESSEIINIVSFCMRQHLPYTVLRDFIFTHPSMSESLNDLANIEL